MIKKRRNLIRLVSFFTAVVVALGIWGGMNMYRLAVIKRDVQVSRERALTQLGTYLDDIDLNLQKCIYSSSSAMLSDVAFKRVSKREPFGDNRRKHRGFGGV